jgi:hypothetical protein
MLNRSPSSGQWALPETIRAYALEKLVESGEAEATVRRLPTYCRNLLGSAGDSRSQPFIPEIAQRVVQPEASECASTTFWTVFEPPHVRRSSDETDNVSMALTCADSTHAASVVDG